VKRNSKFLSAVSAYTFSNILVLSIPLLLLPIMTNYLSPEQYGQVALFLILIQIYGVFGRSFVNFTQRKYFDSDLKRQELSGYLSSTLFLILFVSSLLLIFTLLFKDNISIIFSMPILFIIFALFASVLNLFIEIRLIQWQIRKKASTYAVFQVFKAITVGLLAVIFVVFLEYGFEGRAYSIIYTNLLFFVISVYLLFKDKLISSASDLKKYKEIITYSIPLIPHFLSGLLISSLDRAIINNFIGIAETGIFVVALQTSLLVNVALESVNKAAIPYIYENLNKEEHKSKGSVIKNVALYGLCILLFSTCYWFIIKSIFPFIVGESFQSAKNLIVWIIIGFSFKGFAGLFINIFFYKKKTSYLSIVTLFLSIFHVVIFAYFTYFYGILGSSIAFAGSMFIRWVIISILSLRLLGYEQIK